MGESKQTAQDQFDPRPYQKEWKRIEAAYKRVLRLRVQKARSFLPRLVSAFLELDPELEKVVLFGSLARGIPRQLEFDIDLGVRSKHYFRLLSWALDQPWKIDLVDLDDLQDSPIHDIEAEAIVLYEKKA